jgi:hypothetical protein
LIESAHDSYRRLCLLFDFEGAWYTFSDNFPQQQELLCGKVIKRCYSG